ncbi:hypothetical protein KJY73_04015 [Bowmanella sp. Y26]|uniref:hypothetical protein n=1 Tax=Bowmanella yangjiangensis TaxID=2811230 RepID=UPI001BDD406C|nr:hypothetical protein [Bowmanella yangjiangensis]MBT1062725.1 hypothetical protein [Bowmanella yangjiangensis]
MNTLPKASMRKALLVWIGGLLAIVAVDYLLRLNWDNFYRLGLGENLWFISHWLLAMLSLVVLIRGWRSQLPKGNFMSLLGALLLAVVFYLMTIYLYVLGSGIDSL